MRPTIETDAVRRNPSIELIATDHGGHLGNLGDRRQIADMLDMLAGRWTGSP